MSWLAVRLALRSGREAATRLIMIAAGVALGVVLLLTALASFAGLQAQDQRTGWLQTSVHNLQPSAPANTTERLWWLKTHDEFHGQLIQRVDLAATGPHSPVPPGIAALPGPGQFYASPAMAALLASVPANQLGDRYPGHQIGLIGHGALATPDALVIVVGDRPSQLASRPGAIAVRNIETAPTPHRLSTFQQVGLGLAAAGLLFPILTLVAMATRIAAARREQRLAALRLVGATVRQVAAVAAVEAAAAAFAGALGGTTLFYGLRPTLAHIRVTGDRWYPGDLNPGVLTITAVCIAVPLAAAAAAIATLRRVQQSPLEVTRRVTPTPPTSKRLIPLALGLLILCVFALAGHPYDRGTSSTYAPTVVAGFVLIMIGIIVAGPWLTMAASRLLTIRPRRAATLIAGRRLQDNPSAAFRAVSGLILAVFVGSVFVAGTATAAAGTALGDDPAAASTALTKPITPPLDVTTANAVAAALRSDHGVTGVSLLRSYPQADINGYPQVLIDCHQISATPEIGRCAQASKTVILPLYALDAGHTEPHTVWPPARSIPTDLSQIPVQAVVIATDSTPAALENVRTTVETVAPGRLSVPATLGQLSTASIRDAAQLQRLGDLAILLSVIIAGCALTIAVAGSLLERKRPFALLRLTGMSLRALSHVVVFEAAVPLVALTVISAAGGLITAALLLRALRGATIQMPGPPYYLTLLAGATIALGFVAATMPLLRRISAPENARSE